MPALSFSSSLSMFAAFSRFTPPQPVHTFFRATGYKLFPPNPVPYQPEVVRAQAEVLARGGAEPRQMSTVLCERRPGNIPTIVLGGFVPDSTEQVYLFRGFLLRRGSVYYFNYARGGFSTDLICAQLDDLVEELTTIHHQRPVVFGVSFGAGLVLEWLRRSRAAGRSPDISATVIVSPVACAADIVVPGEVKASTLIGRALKPYLDAAGTGTVAESVVEKSRTIFFKMFEAGSQNKESLRALMTVEELRRVKDNVFDAIQRINAVGATERCGALRDMPPLSAWRAPDQLPLSEAPALILYAEKESSVIPESSPTRAAFESALKAFFPRGEMKIVSSKPGGSQVQHASLIFHYFQFRPMLVGFYRSLKSGKAQLAA